MLTRKCKSTLRIIPHVCSVLFIAMKVILTPAMYGFLQPCMDTVWIWALFWAKQKALRISESLAITVVAGGGLEPPTSGL